MLVDRDAVTGLLFTYLWVIKLQSQVDLSTIISLFLITQCYVLLTVGNT